MDNLFFKNWPAICQISDMWLRMAFGLLDLTTDIGRQMAVNNPQYFSTEALSGFPVPLSVLKQKAQELDRGELYPGSWYWKLDKAAELLGLPVSRLGMSNFERIEGDNGEYLGTTFSLEGCDQSVRIDKEEWDGHHCILKLHQGILILDYYADGDADKTEVVPADCVYIDCELGIGAARIEAIIAEGKNQGQR